MLGLPPEAVGLPVTEGEPLDLLVTTTAECLPELAPGGHLLVAGDAVLTQRCQQASGLPPARVYGWGGTSLALSLRRSLARELDVAPEDVQVCILGGVPFPRFTTVAGVPVLDLIGPSRLEELLASLEADMCPIDCILEALQKRRILPVSTLLQGQYGIDGLYLDVPCKLGARGVEQVLELRLSSSERAALQRSAGEVRARLGLG